MTSCQTTLTRPPVDQAPALENLQPLTPHSPLMEVCQHIAAALQLEPGARDARLNEIVETRRALIDGSPMLDFLAAYTQLHRGPLHPSADIEARSGMPAFQLNDNAPYAMLLANIAEHLSPPQRTAAGVRQSAITQVLWTLGQYFGNFEGSPDRDTARQRMYLEGAPDHTFSIADFRNTGVGMCVEKAALAQNLLAFLGYDTELFGTRMVAQGQPPEGHAFNVIHTDKGRFLLDFSNPVQVHLPNGERSYIPNVQRLSDEEYRALLSGPGVTVTLTHLDFDGTATTPRESIGATYLAPNLSATTARERVQEALQRL